MHLNNDAILVVEDDLGFADFLVDYLKKNGHQAESVGDAVSMFRKIDENNYGCFVVDLGLPDEDGIVVVRKLRARTDAPIIVLTGREGIDDKLACFELGADDYVTKPVDPREMVMRLRAVIGRSGVQTRGASNILGIGQFTFDRSRREVRNPAGETIEFTPAEFALIWVLAQADGELLSRDTLVDAVSRGDGPASFRAVDILVSRVRKKLDKDVIRTVPNAGYKCGWPVTAAGIAVQRC
ncbi:MAG: response regulator [Alphaproteobacteria bacterium]|nr:response regulator [Alphaproteobacteria bacterium]